MISHHMYNIDKTKLKFFEWSTRLRILPHRTKFIFQFFLTKFHHQLGVDYHLNPSSFHDPEISSTIFTKVDSYFGGMNIFVATML